MIVRQGPWWCDQRGGGGGARTFTMSSPRSGDPTTHPPWRWETVDHPEAMESLADEWDALAAGGPLSSLAAASFALPHHEAFGHQHARVALHVLRRGDELMAVFPLARDGRVAQAWTSIENVHHPCWAFAARLEVPGIPEQTIRHLLDSADYLRFRGLPLGGPHHEALQAGASALGLSLSITPYARDDSYLELIHPWEAFEATLSKHLLVDAHKKLDKLHRAGTVAFERITGDAELTTTLEECFHVETLGWKGVTGAPIKRDPHTHRFYRELAARMSARGWFALYVLKLDGRIIAFRYCLRSGSRIDSLKTSFDPAWKRYSPGFLSLLLAARLEIEEGQIERFHVGPPSREKQRWATGVVPLVTVHIYSQTVRGRLAALRPRFRDGIGRVPPLRRALARARRATRELKEVRHRLLGRVGKALAGAGPAGRRRSR